MGGVGTQPPRGAEAVTYLKIIAALVKLISVAVQMMRDQRLIDQGEANAIAEALEETNARVEKARAARAAAAASGMRDDDPYIRD